MSFQFDASAAWKGKESFVYLSKKSRERERERGKERKKERKKEGERVRLCGYGGARVLDRQVIE